MTNDKRTADDRRKTFPEPPLFGELLLDAGWTPEGPLEPKSENWLRSKGVAPDRREKPRRK